MRLVLFASGVTFGIAITLGIIRRRQRKYDLTFGDATATYRVRGTVHQDKPYGTYTEYDGTQWSWTAS